MALLSLSGIGITFGGLKAVSALDLEVEKGEIFGLIGPNGAGKTTIFNLVTGVYRPSTGAIRFDGEDITGRPPAVIAARGIARTFQNIRLFGSMTVVENVMVAGHKRHQSTMLDAVLRTKRYEADEDAARKRAMELLHVMGLRDLAGEVASSLPYGSQRRLEIARGLMLDPKLLLLDEPAAGMNSSEAKELVMQINFLRDELALTIVLVEHNMSVVMTACERVHCVDHGETIAEGRPDEIQVHPKVIAAYLGTEDEERVKEELAIASSAHVPPHTDEAG